MTTVAHTLANTLKELGVKYVFGVPSGNWVDYLAAIDEVEGLEFILVSNEASGGFMADAYWRLTGNVAACFGTFGPGACNLSTGVCGGYLDRSPMIAFTDEMNDKMLYRTTQMNIDHKALFKPITKWTTRIKAGSVKQTIHKAMQIATAEVPGPVHIGLPLGIGADESKEEDITLISTAELKPPGETSLKNMEKLFSEARKPVIALGITSVRSDIRDTVIKILEKFNIPAVLTPMAKGMVPEDHPMYAGVLGHALANHVGQTHQQADLVVGIGYDPVEINYEDWIPDVPLLHIDTSPADLDTKKHTLGCEVTGNLRYATDYLLAVDCGIKDWNINDLAKIRRRIFSKLEPPISSFGILRVLDSLRKVLPKNGIMTCDVGAHLHVIGQQWKAYSPECQLMSNGCSSMGFSIPAAIAAKLAYPQRTVCCVVGDGGFFMMVGEMATAMRLDLKVVFVVIRDANLTLIKLKQENKGYKQYGTNLHQHTTGHQQANNYFGVPVLTVNNEKQYENALQEAFNISGPAVIEVFIKTEEYNELILKGNKPQ